MQKIIIEKSMNTTPEYALEERLQPLLEEGYKILSASTAITLQGVMDINNPGEKFFGVACHMYYVTTVILQKEY